MEHRQNGRAVVEHHLPVGGGDGVFDLGLIALRMVAPVFRRPVLREKRLAAGVVRADVGGVAVVAAAQHLVTGVGPGGHGLGAEGLLPEGRRHLRPQHTLEVIGKRHLRNGIAVQHPERPGAVQLPRRQEVDGLLRLLRRRPVLPHRRHRENRQQEKRRQQQNRHPQRVPELPAPPLFQGSRPLSQSSPSRLRSLSPIYAACPDLCPCGQTRLPAPAKSDGPRWDIGRRRAAAGGGPHAVSPF